jgi:ATP-dependent helicase/nuclease subunit A
MRRRLRQRRTRRAREAVSELFVVRQDVDGSGTEQERLPADAAERARALDVGQSWIVEAPAGSGKTGLLIQRYLKLLAEESVEQPGQVLAITFTKKAAAEIRERVLAQLEAAEQGETGERTSFEVETRALAAVVREKDRRLGWGLMESPQRMNVKTIDSLCAQIAGSMPVLSGGGGGMATVEDAMPLYQAAARRTLMMLGGEDVALNDALRLVLLHRDGNLAEVERLLAEMLGVREQWGELIPLGSAELSDEYLDGTVLPKLQRTLERMVSAGLRELAGSVPGDVLEELAELASSLATIEPYEREVSPIAACAGQDAPGAEARDLEQWRALIHLLVAPSSWTWRKSLAKRTMGFEVSKAEGQRLKRLLERIADREDLLVAMRRVSRLPPAVYPLEQWVVAKALFRLLSRALVELQLVFAERGECDFAELALLARVALRQEGGVVDLQEALGLELRHLLVDEMQDTSTSQYELIELLTQGWDGRSQTLFLVGDPKQSIYLFRRARVEKFVRTMEEQRLGDLPMQCVRLTANFRSQRRLVERFNEDFALVFPRVERRASGDAVQYDAVEAERGGGHSEAGVQLHTRVIEERRHSPEEKRERRRWQKDEAQMVRRIAREWRARPLPEGRTEPWKIAVLVQTRKHLTDIIAALKEDDGGGAVPYRAVKIDELGERQEVMDLFALTRALLHPADRVAWLAVLRAPWCGLSLRDLHAVAGGDDPLMAKRCVSELMVERESLLSEEGRLRLVRVRAVMQAAEAQCGRMTSAEWVERTWRSLGGDVSLTAAELENARRYLRLLDEVEAGSGRLDLSALKRRMTRLYAETAPSAGAVDLMTIHGAKGLEWDVVMVPGLARRAGNSRGGLLVWNEVEESGSEAAHGMLAPIAGRGEPAKDLNKWMRGLHTAREEAERKRLFYVACTRAREELHLFAAPGRSRNGEILREQNSLLKAAWPAMERQFAGAVHRAGMLLPFARLDVESEEGGLAIAASAEQEIDDKPPMVQRLPLSFDPTARFRGAARLSGGGGEQNEMQVHFERPEGSFAARAFGNAVHGFLDLVAERLKAGVSVVVLSAEVAGWGPRAEAVLRGDGLAPAVVRREAQRVLDALQTALGDEEGRWLLSERESAESEYAFTTWTERRRSFRLDRVFVAGTEPMVEGSDCLWIVDYKTAAYGRGVGLEAFLEEERMKYGAQLESYARAMVADAAGKGMRVGLYYPLLPRLLWWKPGIREGCGE